MSAKGGYTKTGKSLKAVRRYYAQLKQKDDDKLSKRIAAELKTQQDANEKRSRREVGQPLMAGSEMPTERSDMPQLMVSPKETGPFFIAPPPPPASGPLPTPLLGTQPPPSTKSVQQQDQFQKKSAKSAKSAKSYKSMRSAKTIPFSEAGGGLWSTKNLYFMIGLALGILLGALGYFIGTKLAK